MYEFFIAFIIPGSIFFFAILAWRGLRHAVCLTGGLMLAPLLAVAIPLLLGLLWEGLSSPSGDTVDMAVTALSSIAFLVAGPLFILIGVCAGIFLLRLAERKFGPPVIPPFRSPVRLCGAGMLCFSAAALAVWLGTL